MFFLNKITHTLKKILGQTLFEIKNLCILHAFFQWRLYINSINCSLKIWIFFESGFMAESIGSFAVYDLFNVGLEISSVSLYEILKFFKTLGLQVHLTVYMYFFKIVF